MEFDPTCSWPGRSGCLGGGIPSLSPHQHSPEGHEELVGPLTAAEGLLTYHLLHSLWSCCEQEYEVEEEVQ